MAKFCKKPVVIEATQWTGIPNEMPIPPAPHSELRKRFWIGRWQLKTLEGWYNLTPGDWIITDVKGERYPCKPDIFQQTYDPEPQPEGA